MISLETRMGGTEHFITGLQKIREEQKLQDFLKEKGFETFTSDGNYFTDRQGNKYGAFGDLSCIERKERVEGGLNIHWVNRGIRKIKLDEDVFNLVLDKSYCWIGSMRFSEEIRFVGKSPLPREYNTAVITPLATWREEGYDGGGQKTLYSLIMLKSREYRKIEFIKDPTEEEKRLRDIRLSEEPF